MGDKPADGEQEQPSLELPKLFGRRRRSRAPEPDSVAPDDGEPTAPIPTAPIPRPGLNGEPEPTGPQPAGGARRAGRAARSAPRLPAISGQVAAVLTGVLVGLFGAALTYGSLQGCEAVRGTKSCGGPGLFLLVAILVLMVLLGAVLLKLFALSDPGSTSFLAVGLTAVVVLVTLMEQLFSAWMFLAVPLISAAAFALARWVSTRHVEPTERGPGHDIR